MNKGKLIVFEGIDGSGKTTQINLLAENLKVPFEVISFPQYGKNEYANKIRDYLEGKMGNISDVDPKEIAKIYAADRVTARDQINKWLVEGKIVLSNRYVPSYAHMAANMDEDKRAEFLDWANELEYQINRMPKEDLVILLDVDPKVSQQHVSGLDIHEQNLHHLEEARKIYLQLAHENPEWHVINCMKDGQMKSREEIHQEIMQILPSLRKAF